MGIVLENFTEEKEGFKFIYSYDLQSFFGK